MTHVRIGIAVAFLSLCCARLSAQESVLIKLAERVNAIQLNYHRGVAFSDEIGDNALEGSGFELLVDLASPEGSAVVAELGMGYSHLTGFRFAENTSDLRAQVRDWPAVAGYLTYSPGEGPFAVYGGGLFSLAELWRAQAYDSAGASYALEGSTVGLGLSGGVVLGELGPLSLLVETQVRRRRFGAVKWGLPSGVSTVPESFPRSLDLSTWTLLAGLYFRLDRPES